MPSVDSAQISLELQMPEDSTLEQTAQVSDEIIERISAMDEVENVGAMLSSGTGSMLGLGGSGKDVTSVSMYILLKEDALLLSTNCPDRFQMHAPIWAAR